MSFKYKVEQFDDTKILKYEIPNFDKLSLKQKKLLYYLQEASLYGRDIYYDQNYKFNLIIRYTLEDIYENYKGNRKSKQFIEFINYLKKFWISNGVYDHYSSIKIIPTFSKIYFEELINNTEITFFDLTKQHKNKFVNFLIPIIFDSKIDSKKVTLDSKKDLILNSATNYYENVTQKEVETFYSKLNKINKNLSWGINSKLVKENNSIFEKVYKIDGLYTKAIEKIVFNLKQASKYSENNLQKKAIEKLIEYYSTGDIKKYDEYMILWLKNKDSKIDFINGFIEQYDDPLGIKGSYESIISIKDMEATKRVEIISKNAQWFENNSPIDKEFKKKKIIGINGKAIDVVMETGNSSPTTPIGVNLPNQRYLNLTSPNDLY